MSIRKLNEEIKQFLEWNESPEFQDFMNSFRDGQTELMQKDREHQVDNAIYYNKALQRDPDDQYYKNKAQQARDNALRLDKKIANKRRSIDKLYKFLGYQGIDVQQLNVETISLEGMNSKDLRKLLTNKVRNSDDTFVLIIPNYNSFEAYKITLTDDGKLDVWGLTRSFDTPKEMENANFTLNKFMSDLNKGDAPNQIFLAYGKNIESLRKERQANKAGSINRKSGYKGKENVADKSYGIDGDTWNHVDRSGYRVDVEGLQKRLDDFKKERGSFSKPIEAAITKLDNLLQQVKDSFSNVSLDADDYKNFNQILRNLKAASRSIQRAKEEPSNERITYINDYLSAAEEELNKEI